MSVILRRIEASDAEALMAFYNALSWASKRTFRPLGEKTTLGKCEEVIRENTPERERKLDIVACEDGRIAGWSFLWNLQADAPTFGLAVADAFHGQGLGSQLMDCVLSSADERGIAKIALTVVCDNDKAREMYLRRGFMLQQAFTGEDGLPYYGMTRERGVC